MKPKTLLLFLLALFFWGGASLFFTLSAPQYLPEAQDGVVWKPASGGLVPQSIRPEGPGDRAGLSLADTLLSVEGVSVASPQALQEVINRAPLGRRSVYRVRRGDNLLKLEIPLERDATGVILHWPLKLAGYLYIFLGILVFVRKPELATARAFLPFASVAGSILAVSWVNAAEMNDTVRFFYQLWLILNVCLVSAFALDFVRRLMFFSPPHDPPPGLVYLTYLPGLLAALFYFIPAAVSLARGKFIWPSGGLSPRFEPYLLPALYGLYVLGFIGEISVRARKKEFVINRRQGLWLKWGVGVPMMIFVLFGMILPAFLDLPLLRWSLLFLLPPPVVLAYLVLKERMMDIGVVIKRSLIYAILSALLLITLLILLMGTSKLIVLLNGQESAFSNFAAIFLAAVVARFYGRKVQNFLDRKFFKDRHNYQRTLLEFSKELAQLEKLEVLLAKTSKRFAEALHLANCLPFTYDPATENYRMVSPYGITDPLLEKVVFSGTEFGLSTLLVKARHPLELYDMETNSLFAHLPVAEKVALKKTETALAVPLLVKDKLVGFLLLGNKKSGDYFSSDDVDFFDTLAASLAVAVENARLYKEELEKREMERELDVARQIQERLVACCRLPELAGVDVAAAYLPARQVSGDLYSVLPYKKDHLALAVGDVSGKGVPASLLMASMQASLSTLVEQKLSPTEIMQRLNRLVFENSEPEHFVTFFLGLLDVESRKLAYVNAGHNPPLYFPPGGAPKELAQGGLLLGMMPEVRYEEGELTLHKNAPVVLYTDGVTEAENHSEESFGTGRLTEIIEQNRHRPSGELAEAIVSGLKSFCDGRDPADDVSLVVLKAT